MEYKYSNQARVLQNDIIGGINVLYSSINVKNIGRCRDSLSKAIEDTFGKYLDDNLSVYAGFLAKVCIVAYFQKFDNDKDIENLKIEYESKDYSGENVIIPDFMFGFDGLTELVTSAIEVLSGTEGTDKFTDDNINSNLLSHSRNIDIDTYLTGGYIEKDIKLVALIGEEPKADVYSEIIEFIKSDNYYKTLYESTTMSILGVYKYLFQDGFGLREYEGVLSFNGAKCHTISDSHRLSSIEGTSTVFSYMASTLEPLYDVIESGSRQFKIKQIIENNSDKPMYFPKKILEYAKGRQLTYRLSEGVYRPHENCISWETYEKAYVKEQVEDLVCQAIYYSLERHFDFKKYDSNCSEFKDSNFSIIWASKRSQVLSDLTSMNMSAEACEDMQKVIKSMCTACVIVRYGNLGGTINSIKLRIVDTTNSLQPGMTANLFRGCTANKNISYEDGTIITEGRLCSDNETPLPYRIFEFSHDFNATLSNAEPMFGYKAVEMYQRRGLALSWNKILLGEDIKGTPLFASLNDKDDIPLQSNTVHNIIAGSRAGKGVMTMNILACAVAEEIPIFYIDRKPDMAVTFTQLSQGNMFCINGGQYEVKNDPRGYCSDTGIATKGWKEAYKNMPQFLKDSLFVNSTYTGAFGDFVYFRAMLFTLSILVARVKLSGTDKYNRLGGDGGIIIVIDEFKNWQEIFESKWFTPNGLLGNKNRITKNTRKDFKKLRNDLRLLTSQVESGTLKPDQQLKAELNIESKEEELNEVVTPLKVYCTELMDKYGDTIKSISELMSAGFKDKEGKKSDIFIIGQNIEVEGYDGSAKASGTYALRDNGEFQANGDTNDKSLMRGLLNIFPHDWIMGYNSKFEEYMGADKKNTTPNKWITGKQYWGYCTGKMETLRTSEPPHTKYFKPYLVLNNNLEDNPNNPKKIQVGNELVADPDYMYIDQCRDRVNKAAPGTNLWEKIRVKHCKKDLTTGEPILDYGNLNEGIGFEGLANMTRHTNGKGDFDPTKNLGQSSDIANYIAQCMGYSDYRELLFDFSPNGLFSAIDMVNAIKNPESFQDKAKVLPLHAEFGIIGGMNESYLEEDYAESRDEEDDYVEIDEERPKPQVFQKEVEPEDSGWNMVFEKEPEVEEDTYEDIRKLEHEIKRVCENVISMKAREYGVSITDEEITAFGDKGITLFRRMLGGDK